LIKQHKTNKDGHAAWAALLTWYDSNTIKNEIAESLQNKLELLKLHQGTSGSQYINQFLTWYNNLERIDGESYSAGHVVYLFLRNITDPDYQGTVVFLRNNDANLDDAVKSIRKTERDLMQKRIESRKLKNYARRYKNDDDLDDSDSNKKESPSKKTLRRWTGTLTPNGKGLISVPYQEWTKLDEDVKTYIQEFNAKVKHGESTSDLSVPKGLEVSSKRRRISKDNDEERDDDNKSLESSSERRDGNNRKKIQFQITGSKDSDDL
jgi:hypothetical protein